MNADTNESTKGSPEYYSHSREEMLAYIPEGCTKYLEVGCGEGRFGSLLKMKAGAEVWGVELVEEEAVKAASKLDKVLSGDFNSCYPQLPERYFDCIVFNDVLEHFAYPDEVLGLCHRLLRDGGYIVASIPNVRFISNLKEMLVKKDWKYKKEGGILDYTHLRFFTKVSIRRMFEETGYEVLRLEGLKNNMKAVFHLINALSLFQLSDSRYSQFACVARSNAE